MAQYPKIESIGSIGSIILALLEVQVYSLWFWVDTLCFSTSNLRVRFLLTRVSGSALVSGLRARRWNAGVSAVLELPSTHSGYHVRCCQSFWTRSPSDMDP